MERLRRSISVDQTDEICSRVSATRSPKINNALDAAEPRLCTLFNWVPGTDLEEHLTPTNVSKLGELIDGLHSHDPVLLFPP